MTVYSSILPPEDGHSNAPSITDEEIISRAYYHLEQRGRPVGSPEVDWYWAIEDLKTAKSAGRLDI